MEVRHTPAVQLVEKAAATPIRFGSLAELLAGEFPTGSGAAVRGLLAELVRLGFLVTSLRAPATVTHPLGYVLDQLRLVEADRVPQVAPVVDALRTIQADLERHNHTDDRRVRGEAQASAVERMQRLSASGRAPVAVDLRLDCDLELPERVAREMEAAASALLRLTAQPRGPAAWRDYHAAVVTRYGVGALVPVAELIDPDLGMGLPAGYPGSVFSPPPEPSVSGRDRRLLALAQQATVGGRREIVLDDATVADLTPDELTLARMPAHVELCARIHAESPTALDNGEFTLAVTPARAAGTMTGRFTPAESSGLAEVFARLPTIDTDAVPAQLSFPPAYPHAENISRTAQFLPYVISLGEHRTPDEEGVIPLEDLAVVADWHRLRLVSRSLGRPVEPEVLHALRLDQHPPPVARFLANLPRSGIASYTEFDWGAATELTYLPRVRYRRSVLSPARWQIESTELPGTHADWPTWRAALDRWRLRWHVPHVVQLHDDDRALRLDVTQLGHVWLLRTHLDRPGRTGRVVLTEAVEEAQLGWLGGHAHEVVVPLVSTRPPAPAPTARWQAQVTNRTVGQLPAGPDTEWLYAKLFVHPVRQSEVVAQHLPGLLADIASSGDRCWWFLRYRSAQEDDHLRLRIRITGPDDYAACAARLGTWVAELRRHGVTGRGALDTYHPEVGRYGHGAAIQAAETVFAADSQAVLAQLRHVPESAAHPVALAIANMVDIAGGFTGSIEAGMGWLVDHPPGPEPAPAERRITDRALALANPHDEFAAVRELPGATALLEAWQLRRTALAAYQRQLSDEEHRDQVLTALLHLHHVRAVSVDRDSERVCRRLARAAALGWQARTRQG